MASWLTSRIKAATELLEAVDKKVATSIPVALPAVGKETDGWSEHEELDLLAELSQTGNDSVEEEVAPPSPPAAFEPAPPPPKSAPVRAGPQAPVPAQKERDALPTPLSVPAAATQVAEVKAAAPPSAPEPVPAAAAPAAVPAAPAAAAEVPKPASAAPPSVAALARPPGVTGTKAAAVVVVAARPPGLSATISGRSLDKPASIAAASPAAAPASNGTSSGSPIRPEAAASEASAAAATPTPAAAASSPQQAGAPSAAPNSAPAAAPAPSAAKPPPPKRSSMDESRGGEAASSPAPPPAAAPSTASDASPRGAPSPSGSSSGANATKAAAAAAASKRPPSLDLKAAVQREIEAAAAQGGAAAAIAAAGTPGAPSASDRDAGGAAAGSSEREARMKEIIDKLQARLKQVQSESHQLEEMLALSEEKAAKAREDMLRVQKEAEKLQASDAIREASHAAALQAKEAESAPLKEALAVAQGRIRAQEAEINELATFNQALLRDKESSQGQLMAAMRDEMGALEKKLAEERAGHAATRKAAAARESSLESTLAESASALSGLQSALNDREARLAETSHRLQSAEEETASLSASLAKAEERLRLEQQRGSQSVADALEQQVRQLKSDNDRLRHEAREAQVAAEAADRELQKMTHELTSARQASSVAESRRVADLDARCRELSEALFMKQGQLERMAAEKAALQLGHEREVATVMEEAESMRRRIKTERAAARAAEEVVPLEGSLGPAYDRLANNRNVGTAVRAGARIVDSTAAQAIRVLKEYPVARLGTFLYVLVIHLMVYHLISKLQHSRVHEDIPNWHVGFHQALFQGEKVDLPGAGGGQQAAPGEARNHGH